MDWKRLGLAAAAVATMGAAPAPQSETMAEPPIARAGAPGVTGYLGAAMPDTYKILPPAPVAGTVRYETDRTAYKATRALENTPRWALAQDDADQRNILHGMACALGVELSPANAPTVVKMLGRLQMDDKQAVDRSKDIYKRKRPFLIDEGPTCVEKTASLAASPDYPSGHNTWGWSVALILAELAPDRATEILARGRAFGEGRVICGVHNLSAAEAGRTNASIVVAALHANAEFLKDMTVARKEIDAARKAGPAPAAGFCAKETEAMTVSPY